MPKAQSTRVSGAIQALKKLLVSAVVVFTFVAYAIHDRLSGTTQSPADPNGSLSAPDLSITASPTSVDGAQAANPSATNTSQPTPTNTQTNTDVPTTTPLPTVTLLPPTDTAISPTATFVPPTLVPPSPIPVVPTRTSGYRNGQFTGNIANAYWGFVQVRATIQNGKISRVQFLNYPHDRGTSVRINNYAVPMLQSEAIQVQSAQVDLISGATLTSEAFVESLQTALNQARS